MTYVSFEIREKVTIISATNRTSIRNLVAPTIAEIICVKNVGAIVVCGFFMKYII